MLKKMSVSKAIAVLPALKKLSKAKKLIERKKLLTSCPCNVLKVIKEIAAKILKGHIHLTARQKARVKRFKKDIRRLGGKITRRNAKRILVQKGGLLKGLLVPAITILANLLSKQIE